VATIVVADNLTLAEHHAVLQGSDLSVDGALDVYGAVVTMSAGEPGPKQIKVIDDGDAQWTWQDTWTPETDDPYMWNGNSHAATTYSSASSASYTFQGASAAILRGLSMCNFGPYTVTLNNQSASFNAFNNYWRYAQTILYFAGGLNPNESYTITLLNYDSNYPNAAPFESAAAGQCNLLNADVDTLSLIVDDVASRDALLATAFLPTASSAVSPSTIAAAVLGAVLFVLLALIVLLLALRQRLKQRTSMGPHMRPSPLTPTPWVSTEQPEPYSDSLPASSVLPGRPTFGSRPNGGTQSRTKLRAAPRGAAEQTSFSATPPTAGQQGATSVSVSSPPASPRTPQTAHTLGDIVTTLSQFLNGHLRQEYLQQEASEGLPEYPNDQTQ